jgi:hypothetical protein
VESGAEGSDAERESERDERTLLALFATAFLCYAASTAGVVGANAGSHYALVRAIAEEGRFAIDSHVEYSHRIDVARRGEHYFSNKAPLTAMAAVPLYWMASLAGRVLPPAAFDVGHDPGRPQPVFVLLLPALASAFGVALVYRAARHFDARPPAAALAALLVGFGSLYWRYATALYHHSPSALALLGLCYAAIRAVDLLREPRRAGALGAAAGLAMAVDYVNVVVMPLVAVYLLATRKLRWPASRREAGALGVAALGVAVPLGVIAGYNTACFGSPVSTGYTYATSWDGGGRVLGDLENPLPGFSTPMRQGLADFLVGGSKVERALLLVSPVLLALPLGLLLLWRRSRADALLLTAVPWTLLAVMSTFRAYWGGSVADTRYALGALPLLGIPLALAADRLLGPGSESLALRAGGALFGLLAGVSVLGAMAAVAEFEGHPIREFRLPIRSLADVSLDAAMLFPGRRHLGVAGACLALGYLGSAWGRGRFYGFKGGSQPSRASVALTIGAAAVVLTAAALAGQGGKAEFRSWEFTSDGLGWQRETLPLRTEAPSLSARGILQLPAAAGQPTVRLEAEACGAAVYVNKVLRLQRDGCASGALLEPLEVSARGFVHAGLNLIEVELRSRGRETILSRAEIRVE